MTNMNDADLKQTVIAKEASLAGMITYAEHLQKRLETTIKQIDAMQTEIDAINELQAESSDDPDTPGHYSSSTLITPPDLELDNHLENK